jgi:hypothetical protein
MGDRILSILVTDLETGYSATVLLNKMSLKEINPSSHKYKSYESNHRSSLFEFSRDLKHSMQRSSLPDSVLPLYEIFVAHQGHCTDSAIGFYRQTKFPD